MTIKSGLAYSNAYGSRTRWRNSSRYVHRVKRAQIGLWQDWISAVWLCGNQSYRITIVPSLADIPEHMTLCPACEKKAGNR